MFGVLVDVSGSMEEAFAAHYDKRSGLTDEKVQRSHGIITTLNNIVNQEITTYEREDLVFVQSFGLKKTKCNGIDTCDFVSMLENRKILKEIDERMARWEKEYPHNGHRILIKFAKSENAPHAEPWIKDKLTQKEAGILWETLKDDARLTKELIDLIPYEFTYNAVRTVSSAASYVGVIPLVGASVETAVNSSVNSKVNNHKALTLARDTVKNKILKETKLETILKKLQNLKPHFAKDVSNLLDTILQENKDTSSSRVHEVIDSITPYIYGRTPMLKALKEASKIFDNSTEVNQKVLFILSDGESTDGDPTQIAQRLKNSYVTIATCYFTSESIPNPKCLVDKEDLSWHDGECALYRMSSTMPNTNAPITHLIDYGWELPLSGECRLFLRANSLDVVEEFCKVAVSQLTHGTDALIHMLGRLSLAEYINQTNDDFKAQQQIGATCYANAIGAVFHLAMHRIADREGGIPGFKAIRSRIIRAYGNEGANTEMVVKRVSPEYRLKCHVKINEEGARKAINERRPVVARFSWKGKQKEMFKKFYERSPKAILRVNDITVEGTALLILQID